MIQFTVATDLYVAFVRDDGTDFTAEMYWILAEDERGNRWSHPAVFHGCKPIATEDGIFFEDVRESARRHAEAMLVQIQRFHACFGIDFAKWSEEPAAYGSAAYGPYDEYLRMDEDERARFF